MRSRALLGISVVLACCAFTFQKNDVIELTNYLHARDSAYFYGHKDVEYTLSKGTQGRVEQVKHFRSGSYGLKIHLLNRPSPKGDVWVYWDHSHPDLKLIDRKGTETHKPENASTAIAKRNIPAIQDPEPQEKPKLASNPDWMMNGMNVSPTYHHPFGGHAACEEVRNLKRNLHVDTILMRKNLTLKDFSSTDLKEVKNDGASDEQILRQLQMDRELGVKTYFDMGVYLDTDLKSKPTDDCSQEWHAWHGTIDYGTPAQYDTFFWNYGQKLLHYADLARKSGSVSVFSIGHELTSLSMTKKLQTPGEINAYVNNLAYFLNPNHMDHAANQWAKTSITDLISFSDALSKREHPVIVQADHRTELQRKWDNIRGDFLDKTASLFRQDAPDYRKEILAWANSGAKYSLSSGATQYLIQLENTRRAYLEGMWEQLIGKVRAKFAGMKHPPLITYDDNGFSGQTGFASKLDVISGSEYGSVGSVDLNPHSTNYGMGIDDGKTSVADLKQGWLRALKPIAKEAAREKKNVIFSELGFSRREHSTVNPWNSTGCQQLERPDGTLEPPVPVRDLPISSTERTNAIEALRELIQEGRLPWLSGIAMWGTYTQPLQPTNEFCIDCELADSTPYESNVRQMFETVADVTNTMSPGDPCATSKPRPEFESRTKHGSEALHDNRSSRADSQSSTVPYVKFSDTQWAENPLGLPALEKLAP